MLTGPIATYLRTKGAQAVLLACILVLATATASAQRKTPALLDWGEFQSIGNLPREFGQVIFAIGELKVPRLGKVTLQGAAGVLEAGGVTDSKIFGARVEGRKLSFATREKNGVSYRFNGAFPENYAVDRHGIPSGVILAGTLVRVEKGNEAARTRVSFRFQFYSD